MAKLVEVTISEVLCVHVHHVTDPGMYMDNIIVDVIIGVNVIS